MRNLQRFCAVAILTLALALSAFAGDMSTPGVKAPPPRPQQSLITGEMPGAGASATGDMGVPGVAALDPATGIVLSLLQSVRSLF